MVCEWRSGRAVRRWITVLGGIMPDVVALHDSEALSLPLAGGASIKLTAFRRSPRIAVTIHGPHGGDGGGVVLSAERARLLGSWLVALAAEAGVPDGGRAARTPIRFARR